MSQFLAEDKLDALLNYRIMCTRVWLSRCLYFENIFQLHMKIV